MSKKLIFILFSVLMFACGNSKKEKMEEMIAGKEYKYWVIYYNCNTLDKYKSFYDDIRLLYFDRNGQSLFFFIFPNGTFGTVEHDDLLYSNTWKLVNDSVVELNNGLLSKILVLTPELFVIENQLGLSVFIAASDSIIPIEYRKIQENDVRKGRIIK